MTDVSGKSKGRTLFEQYQSALDRFPLLVNSIQGLIISIFSVYASQTITNLKSDKFVFDHTEAVTMGTISVCFITPVLLWFYKNVLNKLPGGMARKLFIDQFAFSPVFTACIIGLRFILMGRTSFDAIPGELYKVFPRAITTSCEYFEYRYPLPSHIE
jgi:hypothetical protein